MSSDLALRLVPDELWELAEPLIPDFTPRRQGGGTAAVADRAVFTAIVYVLTSRCAWRHLPAEFGVSVPTAHRRFTAWTRAGLWPRLHRTVLDELGARGQVDRASVIVDAVAVRAKKGHADRPQSSRGSKLHVLSDAAGLPLVVAVSAANVHDSQALKPLLMASPAIRSRRGPRRRRPVKVRADKAYHSAEHQAWLRRRGIVPRIARPGIESGERLGRHRRMIERTPAWLLGYRRLTIRYERHGHLFNAFSFLAAAITCYKKLAEQPT
ncbi:IS5 family transposase [Actinomadura nitritigenes]|uniref:IS5 family transposase n=1 Tax=Actinomadura nitritigenes TaxID=134602 RepID=UPI003D8CD86D